MNSQILKDVISEQIAAGKAGDLFQPSDELCRGILPADRHPESWGCGFVRRIEGDQKGVWAGPPGGIQSLKKHRRNWHTGYVILLTDLLEVEKVQKDRLIIRKKASDAKLKILERLVDQDVDLEFFGMYEPSLNDIFVEKAGDEA